MRLCASDLLSSTNSGQRREPVGKVFEPKVGKVRRLGWVTRVYDLAAAVREGTHLPIRRQYRQAELIHSVLQLVQNGPQRRGSLRRLGL